MDERLVASERAPRTDPAAVPAGLPAVAFSVEVADHIAAVHGPALVSQTPQGTRPATAPGLRPDPAWRSRRNRGGETAAAAARGHGGRRGPVRAGDAHPRAADVPARGPIQPDLPAVQRADRRVD